MKLFFYYAFCSVKNQIKKLCRSWVAVFIAICLLFGFLVGFGAAMLGEFLDNTMEDDPALEETLPEEELPEEIPPMEAETASAIFELVLSALVLVVLFFNLLLADKNGSSIFLMADVNLLFAAPMKPQSVLLFRLMSQIFLSIMASVYLLFQIPTLVGGLGLDLWAVLSVFLTWLFLLIYAKLLNVLVYTVSSTHAGLKKYVRPVLYAVVLLLAGSFWLYHRSIGAENLLVSAIGFFNAPLSRWIPVYGWLKGLPLFVAEGSWLSAVAAALLLSGGIALLAVLVWRIKADFYEDAMAKSQETADRLAAMQEGKTARRKKERADRIVRDGLNFGSGARMFFCKTIYNRFRFAFLRVFTKTTTFYLVIAVGISLFLRFAVGTALFPVVGLALCGAVFFRAMGNPLAADVDKVYFVTVPANPYEKVFWSLLGGTVDCALDLLPALAVGAVLLGASPIEAVAYFLLALGLDFYASNTMLFMELSLPTSLALQIKQAITILFIYFGILPIAAVVIVGAILGAYLPFLFLASIAAAIIGGIFFAFSPLFLAYGRK